MKANVLAVIIATAVSYLPASYALQDLSGTYHCTGIDTKDGKFTGTDTMQLDKKNSTSKIAGYIFNAPEFQGGLSGFGTFDGKKLAIYFYSLDKSSEDRKNNYGVMIASVHGDTIKKIYYEPVYKGGSTGSVECVKVKA